MILRDRGAPHAPPFSGLNAELRDHGPGKPVLLLDMDALAANLAAVKSRVAKGLAVRVVAKSLPSIPLLRHALDALGTRRLMVFDDSLATIARELPDTDILIGKPMPVAAARAFYQERRGAGDPGAGARVRWLVDGSARLEQYAALGRELGEVVQVAIEVDIGLHRGGATNVEGLRAMLRAIESDPQHVAFAGLMGYEAHVVAAPPILSSPARAFEAAVARLAAFKEAARSGFPALCAGEVVWNAGGSKTYSMYSEEGPASEVALGSCLVMPTDFDVPSLAPHVPALYLAAPVLKRLSGVKVPFLEWASRAWAAVDPNREVTYFIYGGGWLAKPVSPAGLSDNPIYGFSTNQAMLNGSARTGLEADDWVFFRPTQSERVMQELGALRLIEHGRLTGTMPVLPFST